MNAAPVPADPELRAFLTTVRTAAVVGLSDSPDRPSHEVARYLQAQGIRVHPVNPRLQEALGETAYADVAALPSPPDVVVVFRRPEDVPPVAEAAIRRGARALWLQLGIRHPAAEAAAAAGGLLVVADRCIRTEHCRLLGGQMPVGDRPGAGEASDA